jgi:hypothetical protein
MPENELEVAIALAVEPYGLPGLSGVWAARVFLLNDRDSGVLQDLIQVFQP